MPKAFTRIPASLIEHFLENGEIPDELVTALEEAIKEARDPQSQCDGEAPIKVFITDDSEDE